MSWKSCGNCGRKPTCGENSRYWCNNLPHEKEFWQPLHCPICGGTLSEIREHNGKKYRHCYACHFEFEENEKASP